MADFSIGGIDAIQAGAATADTLEKIGNTARNAACGFFHSYASIVIPNPAFDFLDGLWDGLCKNSTPGLPTAPAPPFTGGQCPVEYSVGIQSVVSDNSFTLRNAVRCYGPVGGIVEIPNTSNPSDHDYYLVARDSTGATKNYLFLNGLDRFTNTIIFTNRIDGQADSCGDPPPKYPPPTTPPTPTTPGGSVYNLPPVNITFNNGLTFSVTPQLDLSATFSPVIQVGGINVNFGGGGLTVSPPGGSGPGGGGDPTALLNKILKNLGDGTIGGGGVGAAAAAAASSGAAAAKNTAPIPKPGDPGTKPPSTKPPDTHTVKGQSDLLSVEIILTTLPTQRNTIFANDSSYNVYIAGWFSWLQVDLSLERQPIQYANNIFFCPKGADGYTYTLANGAVGHSVVNQGA